MLGTPTWKHFSTTALTSHLVRFVGAFQLNLQVNFVSFVAIIVHESSIFSHCVIELDFFIVYYKVFSVWQMAHNLYMKGKLKSYDCNRFLSYTHRKKIPINHKKILFDSADFFLSFCFDLLRKFKKIFFSQLPLCCEFLDFLRILFYGVFCVDFVVFFVSLWMKLNNCVCETYVWEVWVGCWMP